MKSFAASDEAYRYAQEIAIKLAQEEIQVAQMTAADRTAYGHAVAVLRTTGIPIELAAMEYAEAHEALRGKTTLLEAVRFYLSRHEDCKPKDVADAVNEFLASKRAMSDAYRKALK